jgi:hypothetical protein
MHIDESKLKQEYRSCTNKLSMRALFMMKMPTAAFAGLRVDRVSDEETVVSVPGGWRTQNPFGTMYWAVQGMAAELSTGIVPICISRSMDMKLRMFVVGTAATFGKKAFGRCQFTCQDTFRVPEAIEASLSSGESTNCELRSIGTDSAGETVSEWVFTWNFLATEGK